MAVAMVMVVLVGVGSLLMTVTSQAGNAIQKTAALSLAEQTIETLNNQGPPSNALGGPQVGTTISEGSQVEGNITYTTSAVFNWASVNGTPDLCASGTVPQALDLTVTVKWGTTGSITDTTVLDYPPASVPVDGFIGVQINGDPAGLPGTNDLGGQPWGGSNGRVTNVPVTFTPVTGSAVTIDADTNGCAFIEVPPSTTAGSYTLKVGPVPGLATAFVPPGSASSVTLTNVTVQTNQVTTPTPIQYDEGAFINVQYPNTSATDDGASCPNVSSFQCLVTGQAPTGSNPDGTTGIAATASVLSGSTWISTTLGGVSRIESVACGNLCIGVGYGSGGGAAITSVPTSPTSWSTSTLPSGVTALTQIKCPSAAVCLAIGSGTSGPVILAGTVGSSVAWLADTLPSGLSSLSQITCPSGSGACLAIGSNSSGGAVILAGTPSSTLQTWVTDTLPSGITAITRLSCPASAAACLAIASNASGPMILAGSQSSSTQTWVADTLPAAPTSLTQLTCSGTTACMAIGTDAAGPILIAGSVSASVQTWVQDTLPSGTTAIFQITCSGSTGTTACLALDSNSTTDGIMAGPISATPQTWVADSLPAGVSLLSQISCPSGATACVATGTVGSGYASTAAIVTGAVSTATQTFSIGNVPNGMSPVWFSGISCFGGGPTPSCVVPGATETGAVLLSDSTTGSGSTTWTNSSPSSLNGLRTANLPITVSNSEPPGTSYTPCQSGTCGSSIGPLFPFTAGYSLGAGDCLGELANASVSTSSVPGTSQSAAPTVILPLGLLPIEVVNANGTPVAGATLTAKVEDPTVPANVSCNSPTQTYSFPATGPDGFTRLDVIYETYMISVNSTNVGTMLVTPTSTTFTPATSANGSAAVQPLPTPQVVIP